MSTARDGGGLCGAAAAWKRRVLSVTIMAAVHEGEGEHTVTDMEVGYGEFSSHELPPEMLAFVQTKIDSFIKWDVLRFLKDNPQAADTSVGLAQCVGRQPEVVSPELEEMAEDGLLRARDVGGMTVYSLTQDEATRDLISRFLDGCEDRRFRLRVVFHVARNAR